MVLAIFENFLSPAMPQGGHASLDAEAVHILFCRIL